EMIVTNGNAWTSDKVSVWCDWNNDFEFDDLPGSIEKYVLTNDGTGAVFTGDITAPVGALGGAHRMRVRMTYSVDPFPCDNSSYGEVEDYTIIVGDVIPPVITWNPASFEVFLEEGETVEEFLTIGNIGEGILLWEIDIEPPADPWLTVNPLTGMLDPQGSEEVTLDFDAGTYPAGTVLSTDLVLISNDTLNPEIIIPVTMTINAPPEPHFIFEGGDPSSPLWTIYIGGATLNNSDIDLEAYDEIAIFDGDVMVGAFILEQVCTPENQFENDLTAFSVLVTQPGYQAGNPFSFKCWDASEQLEADVFLYEFFNPYGDAYVGDVFPSADGDYSIATIDFFSIAAQTFNLGFGFQFISSAVDPIDPDMTVVMADVLNDNLDFVRNSLGQTLRKIGPNWVNGIGDWIVDEGYLVKMFADDSFTIMGAPVNPSTPIPVVFGFQFVSYLPADPMDALLAFETIIGDDLDFIRNSQGQTLRKIGPIWVNGIGDASPGEGYLVKMFADGEIIYPAAAKSSGKTTVAPTHLIFEGGNAAEPVYTLYINGLGIGDEVAAYNGDVILGSMSVVSNNVFENDLPIFSQLVSGQGYVAGEPISLKVWSNDNVVVADFEMESVYNSYVSNVYPSNDGEYSVVNITRGATLTGELVIYPNPATNMINISSPNQLNNVVIFNNVGQSVYEGNSTTINTSNFNAGVYIIRIETTNGIETQKFTIK
ncbi:MAG: T9SS type A sorting domain-containing protein, partial [Bacteroidales bacterium]|nr:T9SS type A sorting domain-containing protein [Bacteroidales bacterium]